MKIERYGRDYGAQSTLIASGSFSNLIIFAQMNDKAAILDNPIWSALVYDNAAFGSGTDQVKLFDPEVAPFAGLKTNTLASFRTLYELVTDQRSVVLFSPDPDLAPFGFEIVVKMSGYQMMFEGQLPEADDEKDLVPLTERDVPAMLELTALAQPGPFANRTIDFGGYRGIFSEGRLVAMGGQRLQAKRYTEISAICSHPNHNGKGYARRILYAVIRDITNAGSLAYLHVRADNTRAVELYRQLGFVVNREMNFYVLKKAFLTD